MAHRLTITASYDSEWHEWVDGDYANMDEVDARIKDLMKDGCWHPDPSAPTPGSVCYFHPPWTLSAFKVDHQI